MLTAVPRRRIARVGAAIVVGSIAGLAVLAPARRWLTPAPFRAAYSVGDVRGADRTDEIPAAFGNDEWYPAYLAEIDYAAWWLGMMPLVDDVGLKDGRLTHITVENGYRRSWRAPRCECSRVKVWVYGASTVFGIGQRDDHTIPSELARAAWEAGFTIDVENRGIPGEQHWQEANRLRWDLTQGPQPDLVVFYDGASELVAAAWLNEHRMGDVKRPIQPLTEEFLASEAIRSMFDTTLRGSSTDRPPLPEGLVPADPPTQPPLSASGIGELAVRRYERSRVMSRDIAAANSLPIRWFWQPTRLSRPVVAGEPRTDADDALRETGQAARASLDDGVVDLSDILDSIDRPLFSDDVHHNETAARSIARSILDSIEPDLERLTAAKDPGA